MTTSPITEIEVTRTFSPFQESESEETDFEYWFRHADGGGTSWSQLIAKRLVVVVGEAGIGKTYEFRQQARRLQAEKKGAFFIPLNLLKSPDDWELALDKQAALFQGWRNGTGQGYFFLDAVDEARLTGPDALRRALYCVKRALADHLDRVSLFLSSRISDWNLKQVRELIEQQLELPGVTLALATTESSVETTTLNSRSPEMVPLAVYCLDPLSVEAAKQVAAHHGVAAVNDFWNEITDGAYEFLATRPLDLEWMALLWQRESRLGTYQGILEHAVNNRLAEKNPGYVEAGVVLSREQLRRGIEALAAASVFSGNAYIQVEPGTTSSGVIAPADVMPDWQSHEHQRLLGSAVFDEATYGRVQFHHRALREYLAACWVKRQLDAGLPFSEGWALFARAPYGEELLLPSRRPVLCWLAALEARVRTRVIRSFPEMVIFEGDPHQWSVDDVVEAFSGYLDRVKSGFRADWWNDASEFRRVAQVIPPAQLSKWIDAHRNDLGVLRKLLSVVKHGRVAVCADQVFALYRYALEMPRLLRSSLDVLSVVATADHRAMIAEDLLAGRLSGNELIAAGIEAVGLAHLNTDQLARCFALTEAEGDYGSGAMAMAITAYLLPNAGQQEATLLLAAILSALHGLDLQELIGRHEPAERREGWMFTVLPDVLLKVLSLTPSVDRSRAALVTDAALAIEKLRHTRYVDDQDVRNLRAAIARFPDLRRGVALRIAHSDIRNALLDLIWMSGVVSLGPEDLDWLLPHANQPSSDLAEQHTCYCIARDIAFMRLRGKHRRNVLHELVSGPFANERHAEISRITGEQRQAARSRRSWKVKEIGRKRAAREQSESNKALLLKEIAGIREGSAYGAIEWLVRRSAERSKQRRITKVDVDLVYGEFGPEIGTAFDVGLARLWRYIDAPDSTEYLDNSVPWRGLIGLASANHAFRTVSSSATLTKDEAAKLVRFCVWEHGELEPWFAGLAETRPEEVRSALAPWFNFELTLTNDGPIRRTVNMVLAGPQPLKAALLPIAIERIESGAVSNERLQRTLVSAITTAGLAGVDFLGRIGSVALETGFAATPPGFEVGWFSDWASLDFANAWEWLVANRDKWLGRQTELVEHVAAAMGESSEVWKSLDGDERQVSALADLFRHLDSHLHNAGEHGDMGDSSMSSAWDLWNRIPNVLSTLQGKNAYRALIHLGAKCDDPVRASSLKSKAREQAARDAEEAARISTSELPSIGEPFTCDPRTEAELFEQVMARLAEIAEGVERGPFSERGLFSAGIPEKQLQLWLAARLEDTPRRSFIPRFSVSREPTVDADKRTDIEVSSRVGKICIEVKPLDQYRGYSAKSLAEDTLDRQIVGQYLRGRNSRHGVLIVFRLDTKTWQIPGHDGNRGFGELVDFLRARARAVVEGDPHVQRLEVLSIDCTPPP